MFEDEEGEEEEEEENDYLRTTSNGQMDKSIWTAMMSSTEFVRECASQWVSEVEWGGVVAIAIAEISICKRSSPESQEHVMKQSQHNVLYTKHLMEKEGRGGREVVRESVYVCEREGEKEIKKELE